VADGWLLVGLAPLLVLVAIVDARTGRIPNAVNAAIACLGFLAALEWGTRLAAERLLDAGVVGLSLLLLRWAYRRSRGRTGLGLGDVKFLSAATLWTGLGALPLVLFLACLSALAMVAGLKLAGRKVSGGMRLRFGPHLAGALACVLVLDRLIA